MTIAELIKNCKHFELHLTHYVEVFSEGDAFNTIVPMIRGSREIVRELEKVKASAYMDEEAFQSLRSVCEQAEQITYLLEILKRVNEEVFQYVVKEGHELMRICGKLYNTVLHKKISIKR